MTATVHRLINGDARDLSFLPDESVHLVLTSPPYWNLKRYNENPKQLGHIDDYETFLAELQKVWEHAYRVLVPGGRLICVVGDVCLSRRRFGRHLVFPPALRYQRDLPTYRIRQSKPNNLAQDS